MADNGGRNMPISVDGASRFVPSNLWGGLGVQTIAAPPRRWTCTYPANKLANRVATSRSFVKYTPISHRWNDEGWAIIDEFKSASLQQLDQYARVKWSWEFSKKSSKRCWKRNSERQCLRWTSWSVNSQSWDCGTASRARRRPPLKSWNSVPVTRSWWKDQPKVFKRR